MVHHFQYFFYNYHEPKAIFLASLYITYLIMFQATLNYLTFDLTKNPVVVEFSKSLS